MGMIAFYAGLFIGILLGFLFSSLWAFSLAKHKGGVLPDQAERYPQADLPEALNRGCRRSQVLRRWH